MKKLYILSVLKAANLNQLVQGGQLYWAFPFSKDSLLICFEEDSLLICFEESTFLRWLQGNLNSSTVNSPTIIELY
jgi:hypothetical protein